MKKNYIVIAGLIGLLLLGAGAFYFRSQPSSAQTTDDPELTRLLNLPDSEQKYLDLASYVRSKQQYDDSEKYTLKALEINPDSLMANLQIGNFYTARNRFDEAEAHIKKAIDIAPDDDWPYIQLGNLYNKQGKESDAITAYRKAIALNSSRMWGYKELGRLLAKDPAQTKEAETLFLKAIELHPQKADNPTDTPPYKELEQLYRSEGRTSEADAIAQKEAAAPVASSSAAN